jgi:YggT family protein
VVSLSAYIGYFIIAVARVLDFVLIAYMWLVIARAVLSWVNPDPFNPIVRFIHNITEPVLYQVRSRIPVNFGGMDVSPIVVFLCIIFLRTFVVNSLNQMARSMM